MEPEIDELFNGVRRRFDELKDGPKQRFCSFVAHIRSLAHWESDRADYPDPSGVAFPKHIHIAFAVCNKECGRAEFIVDGSTQECQACGSLMFRTQLAKYELTSENAVGSTQ